MSWLIEQCIIISACLVTIYRILKSMVNNSTIKMFIDYFLNALFQLYSAIFFQIIAYLRLMGCLMELYLIQIDIIDSFILRINIVQYLKEFACY